MIAETKKDGNDGCEGKRKWSPVAKVIGTILAILFALFVGITALGYYWPDIQNYRYRMENERVQKMIDDEKARILAVEKADTFGGKTPEETFDMFLAALNKGDIELASKYYDATAFVSKNREKTVQAAALEGLKKELTENGNLNLSIKYFTDVRGGEKKCNVEGAGCSFDYSYITTKEEEVTDILGNKIKIEKGDTRSKFLDLKTYQTTKLWKIIQPY